MKFPLSDFFQSAVDYVILNETGQAGRTSGGFTCDPIDRGGATKWGITRVTLSLWRGHDCSVEDVMALERIEAEAIYRGMYWQSISCHQLKKPQIATAMFDLAVLFGVGVSARYAQLAAQKSGATTLKIDGHVGPKTIEGLNVVNTEEWLKAFQDLFKDRVSAIIQSRPEQIRFRGGWLERIERLKNLT